VSEANEQDEKSKNRGKIFNHEITVGGCLPPFLVRVDRPSGTVLH
jgi:hypothetical protein